MRAVNDRKIKNKKDRNGFSFLQPKSIIKSQKKCPDLFACLQKPCEVAAVFHECN